MPRPSNTEERRAQIRDALVAVMAKRGYDGASIADIAEAAGLSPGLVHYHFKNKQEILLAALDVLVASHLARLDARLDEVRAVPIEEIGAFIDFHLGLDNEADPEGLACWILLTGEALRQEDVRVPLEAAIEAIAARLSAAIRRGIENRVLGCEPSFTDAAASAIVAVIHGYFVIAATARSVIPTGYAAMAAKRMANGLLEPVSPFEGSY